MDLVEAKKLKATAVALVRRLARMEASEVTVAVQALSKAAFGAEDDDEYERLMSSSDFMATFEKMVKQAKELEHGHPGCAT